MNRLNARVAFIVVIVGTADLMKSQTVPRSLSPPPAPPKVERHISNGNSYFRSGSLLVSVRPDLLELQIGADRWQVDFSKLPIHAVDCESANDRKECASQNQATCLNPESYTKQKRTGRLSVSDFQFK